MTNGLLGPDGRPVRKPEITAVFTRGQATDPVPVRGLHHHDNQPKDERDLLSECEWDCGPGGPLGFFERAPGLWVVFDGISGRVVGCAESRHDALFLIGERHAKVTQAARERARRREEARENYDRKLGTW